MAPIYNPPASGGTSISNDEQYFTDLGLLSGLSKIIDITGGNTFPTPDASAGTAAVITNNMIKWGAAYAESFVGYNIGTMSTVLAMGYTTVSRSGGNGPIISKELSDSSNAYGGNDFYWFVNSPATAGGAIYMYKRVAGTFTILGTDITIWSGGTQTPLPCDPGYGWAIYVTDSVQKGWFKSGPTGNFMPIFSTTDSTFDEFKSVALHSTALNMRNTTPFTVWGA
jgi:hypothetical protein